MPTSSWIDVEDIALVEAWEFESYYKDVEDSSQDLGEENIKAVALINYRHKEGHDFEHVLQWETMRVWL
ncbi:hypothetical protein Hanom_Chr07g00632801 [Helianthus anomalus]